MIPNHIPDGPEERQDRRSAPSITVSLSHLPYYLALLIIVGIAWTGISKASQLVDAVHASTVANNELQGKLDLLSTKIDGLSDRVTRLENSASTTVVVPRGRP